MNKRIVRFLSGVTLALMTAAAAPARAESVGGLVEEGNRLFRERRLSEAIEMYRRAQRLDPSSPGIHYNIGNVLYQQGQFDQAYDEYRQAFAAHQKDLAEGALFNAGNSHLARRNWPEAIRRYQEALKLEPSDNDAKKNLELALKELLDQKKKQQPKPKQGQQDQPPPPDPNAPRKPDDQNQNRHDQKGNGGQPPPGQDQQKQEGSAPKESLSRQEAMRLLNAVKAQDKGTKRLIQTRPPDRKPERDW
jgi:tetratricopeptide (TPR) repeat protein